MASDTYMFRMNDLRKLLKNKFIVFIGDSVIRSMYKDIVLLYLEDRMLKFPELKRKGEMSFLGDELIEGGEKGGMTNGKDYREVRQYQRSFFLARFYFVTRVYSSQMETIITDLIAGPSPDIVIMNSCLWDITRYGPNAMRQYELNLQRLFQQFKKWLPSETLVIWTTALPVSEAIRGGFLLDTIQFFSDVLRVDVLAANYYASQVAFDHDFDVVDLHYAFRRHVDHRAPDGIHWDSVIHRAITNMLLLHICDAWHVKVPSAHSSASLCYQQTGSVQQQVPQLTNSNNLESSSRSGSSIHSDARYFGQENRSSEYSHADSDRISFGSYPNSRSTDRGHNSRSQSGSNSTVTGSKRVGHQNNYKHHPY